MSSAEPSTDKKDAPSATATAAAVDSGAATSKGETAKEAQADGSTSSDKGISSHASSTILLPIDLVLHYALNCAAPRFAPI